MAEPMQMADNTRSKISTEQANEDLSKLKDETKAEFDEIKSQLATITALLQNQSKEKKVSDEDRPPKIKFPVFNGESPRQWVRKCERYFDIYKIHDEHKVGIAEIHLQDKADQWFGSWIGSYPQGSWKYFSQEICKRFTTKVVEDGFGKLVQTTSVDEYQERFDEMKSILAMRNPGLSEDFYISSFVGGLKEEIKSMVRVLSPRSLIRALEIARAQENVINSLPKAMLSITFAQLQEKHEKALCFRCDEKFVAGHKCKNKQLSFILVEEEEIHGEIVEEPAEVSVNELSQLSSNAPTRQVEKISDKISALQQLVCPFGKTDTTSVLTEAIGYIKFLHDQVNVLITKNGVTIQHLPDCDGQNPELKSRGLCLVPISSTLRNLRI